MKASTITYLLLSGVSVGLIQMIASLTLGDYGRLFTALALRLGEFVR